MIDENELEQEVAAAVWACMNANDLSDQMKLAKAIIAAVRFINDTESRQARKGAGMDGD